MARLPPSTSGPSVSAAQYTRMRWPSGRWVVTRQMSLSVWSMVSTSDSAVTNSTTRPTAPSSLALVANWVM